MPALFALWGGLALCSSAWAAPGLRTDGVVPPLNQGEGAFFGAAAFDTLGGTDGGGGLMGGFGLPQDVGLELALGMDAARAVGAELRVVTPLLGRRDDPLLSVLGGLEASDADGGFDTQGAYSLEVGVVASAGLVDHLRLYGGATAASRLDELIAGAVKASLTVEPAVGLCWRPVLKDHLAAKVAVEAQGWTDLDRWTVGPAVVVGIGGR